MLELPHYLHRFDPPVSPLVSSPLIRAYDCRVFIAFATFDGLRRRCSRASPSPGLSIQVARMSIEINRDFHPSSYTMYISMNWTLHTTQTHRKVLWWQPECPV